MKQCGADLSEKVLLKQYLDMLNLLPVWCLRSWFVLGTLGNQNMAYGKTNLTIAYYRITDGTCRSFPIAKPTAIFYSSLSSLLVSFSTRFFFSWHSVHWLCRLPTVKLATTAISLKVRITLFTRNYVPLIPCALECKSAHFHYWSFSIQMNIQIKSRLQSRLLYTMHSRRLARLVLLHLL